MTAGALKVESTTSLAQEVTRRSGQDLLACYQCRRCAAGCPVGEESGVTPDRLIRMILLGDSQHRQLRFARLRVITTESSAELVTSGLEMVSASGSHFIERAFLIG